MSTNCCSPNNNRQLLTLVMMMCVSHQYEIIFTFSIIYINHLMINNCIQCIIVEIKAKRIRFLSTRHYRVSALL